MRIDTPGKKKPYISQQKFLRAKNKTIPRHHYFYKRKKVQINEFN